MKFNSTLLLALCIAAISCFSCKRNDVVIEGDLYFAFIRIGSFYNEPDSIVKGFTSYVDTVNINNLHAGEKHMISMYDVLKKNNCFIALL